MSDNVFRVNYRCSNCGANFSDDYPAKTQVNQEILQRVQAHYNPDHSYCPVITCPICELDQGIIIESREPLPLEIRP